MNPFPCVNCFHDATPNTGFCEACLKKLEDGTLILEPLPYIEIAYRAGKVAFFCGKPETANPFFLEEEWDAYNRGFLEAKNERMVS
jgi:hypothetical protein